MDNIKDCLCLVLIMFVISIPFTFLCLIQDEIIDLDVLLSVKVLSLFVICCFFIYLFYIVITEEMIYRIDTFYGFLVNFAHMVFGCILVFIMISVFVFVPMFIMGYCIKWIVC